MIDSHIPTLAAYLVLDCCSFYTKRLHTDTLISTNQWHSYCKESKTKNSFILWSVILILGLQWLVTSREKQIPTSTSTRGWHSKLLTTPLKSQPELENKYINGWEMFLGGNWVKSCWSAKVHQGVSETPSSPLISTAGTDAPVFTWFLTMQNVVGVCGENMVERAQNTWLILRRQWKSIPQWKMYVINSESKLFYLFCLSILHQSLRKKE